MPQPPFLNQFDLVLAGVHGDPTAERWKKDCNANGPALMAVAVGASQIQHDMADFKARPIIRFGIASSASPFAFVRGLLRAFAFPLSSLRCWHRMLAKRLTLRPETFPATTK
jgi:hypothetical protein